MKIYFLSQYLRDKNELEYLSPIRPFSSLENAKLFGCNLGISYDSWPAVRFNEWITYANKGAKYSIVEYDLDVGIEDGKRILAKQHEAV